MIKKIFKDKDHLIFPLKEMLFVKTCEFWLYAHIMLGSNEATFTVLKTLK